MAPEVLFGQNHTYGIDYFALGVMTFEFMNGKVILMFIQRPYVGKNRKEIKEHIISKQIRISKADLVNGWSNESADFINKVKS